MTDKKIKVLFQVTMIFMLMGGLWFIHTSDIQDKNFASTLVTILVLFPLFLTS